MLPDQGISSPRSRFQAEMNFRAFGKVQTAFAFHMFWAVVVSTPYMLAVILPEFLLTQAILSPGSWTVLYPNGKSHWKKLKVCYFLSLFLCMSNVCSWHRDVLWLREMWSPGRTSNLELCLTGRVWRTLEWSIFSCNFWLCPIAVLPWAVTRE